MLFGEKKNELEKQAAISKEDNLFNFSSTIKKYINIVSMNEEKAKKIILENKNRILDLHNLLETIKGKGIKIDDNKKKYSFVKKEVSDQTLLDFIILSVLNEKIFGLEAELMLAIASQESNFTNPPKKIDGRGYFQITPQTFLDLKQRFFKIAKFFSEIEILQDKKKELTLYDKLFNAFKKEVPTELANQFILASLVFHSKRINSKNGKIDIIPLNEKNYKKLFKKYNGNAKYQDIYADEVDRRFKYLKNIKNLEKRKVASIK